MSGAATKRKLPPGSGRRFNGVKVFSATMEPQRAPLGETLNAWLDARPHVEVVDIVVTQSSDDRFHCISLALFYREPLRFCHDIRRSRGEHRTPPSTSTSSVFTPGNVTGQCRIFSVRSSLTFMSAGMGSVVVAEPAAEGDRSDESSQAAKDNVIEASSSAFSPIADDVVRFANPRRIGLRHHGARRVSPHFRPNTRV